MLHRPWYLPDATIYQAPEGEGGSGGGGGDDRGTPVGGEEHSDDGGDGGAPKADPRLDALENAVKVMAQGQAAINQTLGEFAKGLEALSKPREAPKNEDTSGDDDVDLETMDRKSFAAHLTGKLKGIVEESLKPLGERFGKLDEKIDAQGLSVMIKDFQKDHPDFFEWKPEMRALLQENPTLTPARAYALVRAESPDKAKQLDKKYGLFKEPARKNGENNLMSLFPTGSGSATKGNAKMTPVQAAEAAWDEVMSNLGSS